MFAGCRLDPAGTAAELDDGDDVSPSAERGSHDGSVSRAPSSPQPAVQKPVRVVDASVPAPRVDASAAKLDAVVPAEAGAGADDAGQGDAESAPVDAGPPSEETPDDACTIQGAYALETEVDVAWDGSSVAGLALIAGGTGKVVMRALTMLDGSSRQATISPCDLTLPDFETAPGSVIGKELYGMDVPQAVWENASMPRWSTPWGLSCDRPGCAIFSGMIQAVLGARVTSMPFSWPSASGPRDGFEVSDDDADGLSGLTLITRGPDSPKKGDQPYAYPPLVTSLLSRARAVMVAIGLRAQMQGTLESCDRYSGALSFGGVYARTLGCTKQFGMRRDAPCEATDLQFLDDHLPIWRVEGGSFRATRIHTPTCEAVRALDFAR